MGVELTKEIVAEILCSRSDLLDEVAIHDKAHKVLLIKKIVFSFISVKGKHLCRSINNEQNSLIRHYHTKNVIFKHE
jgi:hypothetical protein